MSTTQRFSIRSPKDLARTITEARLARKITQSDLAIVAGIDRDALIREATGWKMNKQTAITTIDQTLEQLRTATVHHDELAGLIASNLDRIQRR